MLSSVDVLFWLLMLLVAGLAFLIEAGVTTRHRRIVLSSIASVSISALYILFILEDNSSFNFGPRPGPLGNGGGGGDRGMFEYNNKPPDSASVYKGKGVDDDSLEKIKPGPFTDCAVCPVMVFVPAGRFRMGAPDDEPGARSYERPTLSVKFAQPFAVSRTEITRKDFKLFVDDTRHRTDKGCTVNGQRTWSADWLSPGFPQTDDHPVVCISYRDARAYTDWLSKKSGKKYRLLSEAQWEYAARAGSETAFWNGPTINPGQANFDFVTKGTVPAGSTPTNPYGLSEVHGNVWELTEDCWTSDMKFLSTKGNPTNLLGDCSRRVMRGGAWDSKWNLVRSASRAVAGESAISNTIGLRVARDRAKIDKAHTGGSRIKK
ncbi:MAG: hypothetical protein RLZ98_522 [Pseudomonadota bacterium]|jgi:formylglycine-generating enzyme required for sulfatase activity